MKTAPWPYEGKIHKNHEELDQSSLLQRNDVRLLCGEVKNPLITSEGGLRAWNKCYFSWAAEWHRTGNRRRASVRVSLEDRVCSKCTENRRSRQNSCQKSMTTDLDSERRDAVWHLCVYGYRDSWARQSSAGIVCHTLQKAWARMWHRVSIVIIVPTLLPICQTCDTLLGGDQRRSNKAMDKLQEGVAGLNTWRRH